MSQTRNNHGFVNTRGPKEGHCNICDDFGPLTEDHVPPKGTLLIRQADLFHIIELLNAEAPGSKCKFRHMQSGVNFRSLCGRCNNSLLGAEYDPALIEFSNTVTQFLKTAVSVPELSMVEVNPGRISRAVIGHLFAVGIERRERTPMLKAAEEFFLSTAVPLSEGVEIYYWVYPYRRQVAIRDGALLTDFFKSPPIVFWCLKYFPLGFIVTWGNDQPKRVRLPKLRDFMLHGGDHPAKIPVSFKGFPHQSWPEAPESKGAVLYGDGSVGAVPRAG